MLELTRLQRSFWSALTHAEDGPAAPSTSSSRADLTRWIRGDARAAASDRLALYASMYFHRLLDALAADFPRLAAVLGARTFGALAARYLAVHPSLQPSLRHLGRALPQFLRAAPGDSLPWHADLAALEWARLDVHDRRDELVLTLDRFREAASRGFAGLRLAAIAAHERVVIDYDVRAAWRAAEAVDTPRRGPGVIVVWRRPDHTVHHRLVSGREAQWIADLAHGLDFATLCATLGRDCSAVEAAQRAVELVGAWTADGLLAESLV